MGLLDRQRGASHTLTGAPFEIWGQRGWANVDVVGESFHTQAIRSLLGRGKLPGDGLELTAQVHLVHNNLDRHDHNAIQVHGSSGLLGHLSREDAARYVPVIDSLQERGLIATTTARIWGRDQKDWDSGKQVFVGSVRVDLPEPHMMTPHNQPPTEAHQLLPNGTAIRVSAADRAAEATTRYLCREGECWVHATLHEVVEQGPRSSKQLAELRIDGRPVGRLTPKMSGDMLPAVQYLDGRRICTAVRAIVKGNQLKCEVIVHAARASELPPEWFTALPQATNTATPATTASAPATATAQSTSTNDDTQTPAPASEPQLLTLAGDVHAAPPQGWYPDPTGTTRLRWWDGTTWTQHTAP